MSADSDRLNEQVADIYHAGAISGQWPEVLDRLSRSHGARGANLIRNGLGELQMISTTGVQQVTEEWAQGGWDAQNTRVTRLLARSPHPGFLTDSDLHSEAELESLPIYTEFLSPRGFASGSGTTIQGVGDEFLILAFEGFADKDASRKAVAALDALRPHLARAMVLSTEIEASGARSVIEAFEAVGTPIALLNKRAGIVAANDRFRSAAEGLLRLSAHQIRPLIARSASAFDEAFSLLLAKQVGDSIALRGSLGASPAVLHLVPRLQSSGHFNQTVAFAIIAEPGNNALPRADIIAALFDLTPAEARVARAIGSGRSTGDVAQTTATSSATVRTQLKRIFQRTAVARQSELVALLAGIGSRT